MLAACPMHRSSRLFHVTIRHCRVAINLNVLRCGVRADPDDDRKKRFLSDVKATNHTYILHPEAVALTHVSSEYCQSECGVFDQDLFNGVCVFILVLMNAGVEGGCIFDPTLGKLSPIHCRLIP